MAVVGDLLSQGFSVGQSIGLAYDNTNQNLYFLDRSGGKVYTMDSTTGDASLLFNPLTRFQEGAIANGILYGIDESRQKVEGYSLTTFNRDVVAPTNIPASEVDRVHALGEGDAAGQIYTGVFWGSGR